MASQKINDYTFLCNLHTLQALAASQKEEVLSTVHSMDGSIYKLAIRAWNGSRREVSNQDDRDDPTIRGFHIEGSIRDSNGFGHVFPFDTPHKCGVIVTYHRDTDQVGFKELND